MTDVGFSGYPERDIKTHRQTARITRIACIIISTALFAIGDTTAGVSVLALGIATATSMENTTLEWELERLREGCDEQ